MTHEISKTFTFESAHYLPYVPDGHKCGRIHGHSYRCTVYVAGDLDRLGWVVDFAAITEAFEPIRRALDHQTLNDIVGLDNPTSELLATWIWNRLAVTGIARGLSRVEVSETAESSCSYTGPYSNR